MIVFAMGELDPADAAVLAAAFEADYHGCAENQPRFGVVAATTTVLEAAARLVSVHSYRPPSPSPPPA